MTLRRFVCAVAIAAALIMPSVVGAEPSIQTIDPASGSATCGNASVTWSVPKPTFSMDPQTATIHAADAAGNALFDLSQQTIGPETVTPAWCGDLLGDGRQELDYIAFSGGAHCCFGGSVVALDGSGQHLLDWGLGSYGLLPPQQIDGTGPLEIPAVSPLFNYYDNLGFANSPALPVVYAYDGSSYVEATARFPGYLAAQLTEAEADLGKARPANFEQEAAALKVYALHLLMGDGEQALVGLQGRVTPATRGWLSSHAAEVRSMMAKVYALPGAPVGSSAPVVVAAPAAPTIIPVSAPAPVPAAAAPTIIPAPAPATSVPSDASPSADAAEPGAAPDTLSAAVRSDIVDAVQRANNAWSTASRTLDASVLNGNVADSELSNDQAELNTLRGRGQTRNNVNVSFAVMGVSLDAPGQATVRTHETWYAEIYANGGRLLQVTPSETYDESYVVEFQNGAWIVTRNDL